MHFMIAIWRHVHPTAQADANATMAQVSTCYGEHYSLEFAADPGKSKNGARTRTLIHTHMVIPCKSRRLHQ